MARTVEVVYIDGSRTSIPVTPSFKLRARRGTMVPLTLRDGSRALIGGANVALLTVRETLQEEDHGA